MIKAKQVNIKKNKYFTVDMNDLDPFLLDIKKKNLLKKLIFITLIIFKKNFNSSIPLCAKINSATGYFREKNDDKYLILDSKKEYESVWSEIKSEIKRINGGEEVFYEKSYCKVSINTEDDLPLKKSLKFLTLTVNINLVLQANNNLYPQIYLNECFYEL